MATFKDGILGPASGSLSDVVLSSRNGVPYIKAKPEKVHNPQTPRQQATRMKLSLLSGVLKRFKEFIKRGMEDIPQGKSARDVAYSMNYPDVFEGEYPDIRIRYPAVKVSRGSLEPLEGLSASIDAGQQTLQLQWDVPTNGSASNSSPGDGIMLLGFEESTDTVFTNFRAATRRDGGCTVPLPDQILTVAPADRKLHLWVSCFSSRSSKVSDSVYSGVGG